MNKQHLKQLKNRATSILKLNTLCLLNNCSIELRNRKRQHNKHNHFIVGINKYDYLTNHKIGCFK